jgi:uncharacterized membrane protein YbaN (DUF454 family)
MKDFEISLWTHIEYINLNLAISLESIKIIMTFIKTIFICLGTISLCIGALGIIIPGLPATPFFLLTAALYIRSSDKLYHALISNKQIGSYILKFRTDKGMKKGLKLHSVIIMWIMIIASCLFFITSDSLKLFVLVLGIIGTIVMLFFIPTTNKS